MSLETALKAVGLLVGGYLLVAAFVAMGPIGWLVFGTLLAVSVIQVHRKRAKETDRTHDETGYCPDCGVTVDLVITGGNGKGGDRPDLSNPSVRYCPNCGESIDADGDTENAADSRDARQATGTTNCAACGAPNDPDRTTCKHCETALS